MLYREHDGLGFLDDVEHSEWKSPQHDSANIVVHDGEGLRRLGQHRHGVVEHEEELVPETLSLLGVVGRSLEDIDTSTRLEPDGLGHALV